jgi:ribosomal protein L7/L12
MFSLFSGAERSADDAARLRRVERKLDLILTHLGIDDEAASGGVLPDEVRRLADEGRTIEAIKAHRDLLGSGLREAKEAVEAYRRG